MKKGVIVSLIVSISCLLVIPLTIAGIGFNLPPQYDETYYGELPHMFNRLKNTKEQKIIFVGNSSLAFGINPEMIEQELPNYKVVNFGLYGALGTKLMIDLSKVNIQKSDIVVLVPEISSQGCSLYFSSENTWMAMDGHYEMLRFLDKENRKSMTGGFAKFVSNKLKYINQGKKPSVNGVYRQDSFNKNDVEVGYMTYLREYNTMVGGVDINNKIIFDKNLLSKEFVSYLNDYSTYISKKGAKLFYGFGPMNKMSNASSEEQINDFYDYLDAQISFPILGQPNSYLFDYDWFYDNNFHLNTPGMNIYNKQIVEDLKIVFDDTSETNILIPEKPTIPVIDYEDGDNSDVSYFAFESFSNGYQMVSMTESATGKASFIIPSTYNDLPVITFTQNVFANNKSITEITIPKNTHYLPDYAFEGCDNLSRIILQHDSPYDISVGTSLLDGTKNCRVFVKEKAYENFINHYNWGPYRDYIEKY